MLRSLSAGYSSFGIPLNRHVNDAFRERQFPHRKLTAGSEFIKFLKFTKTNDEAEVSHGL